MRRNYFPHVFTVMGPSPRRSCGHISPRPYRPGPTSSTPPTGCATTWAYRNRSGARPAWRWVRGGSHHARDRVDETSRAFHLVAWWLFLWDGREGQGERAQHDPHYLGLSHGQPTRGQGAHP